MLATTSAFATETPATPQPLIDRVLAWLGVSPVRASTMLRSAEDVPPLDIWTLRSGQGFSRVTNEGGYATPIFCGDGSLLALHDGVLRILSGRPGAPIDVAQGARSDPFSQLLACRRSAAMVFTKRGTLLTVDLASGAQRAFSPPLGVADRAVVWASARTCGVRTVRERYPDGTKGFSDLVVTKPDETEETGTLVTGSSPLKFHLMPAFSADCQTIVFAGAPYTAPVAPVTPAHSSRGCACEAARSRGFRALPLVFMGAALILARGRRRIRDRK